MKTIKNVILSVACMFLMASCATTVKFPISTVTPAAVISAKMKKDKNNNYAITITAKNLASVERLTPPKKTYVVWIVIKENEVKNVGQFKIKNAVTATLETMTSFKPRVIFITAEDQGDVSYPSGIEITRATF